MLIITEADSIPADFKMLAQNMKTYEVCGYSAEDGFETADDIPPNFEQRVLPYSYGRYLNISQITSGLMLENRFLQESESALVELDELRTQQLDDVEKALLEIVELMIRRQLYGENMV